MPVTRTTPRAMSPSGPSLLAALALLALPVAGAALAGQSDGEQGAIAYASTAPTDAVSRLQRDLDEGRTTLEFDPKHGYLPSVLSHLHVPVSSQGLVFSRTSLQVDHIAPWAPRAVYFNDDVYVGWVQGGPIMEVADADPKLGGVFYTLEQQPGEHPKFERQTSTCLQCHDSSSITGGVPGFILRSVFPDRYGYVITPIGEGPTTDRTPIDQRWGGWYVTGTLGGQPNMGNTFAPLLAHDVDNVKRTLAAAREASTGDVTDLKGRVSTKPYLSASSDAVALMVLAHQSHVHNLITIANYEERKAAYDRQLLRQSSSDSAAADDQLDLRVRTAAERLLRGLLFAKEAPLAGPIAGTSSFASDFEALGPRDHRGRSLRDFDLKARLFRYPLSYLIYSESFNALPAPVKGYVYRRLREVLTGADTSEDFAGLSASDREAILQILDDTKPDFAGSKTTVDPAGR